MQTVPIQLPLDVALYFVQQLPPNYQEAIFEWLVVSRKPAETTDNQVMSSLPLEFGAGKHLINFIADDFNETPEEFNEYM
jgi:hypothetical protein